MYTSMRDMHRMQQREQREQVEIDEAVQTLRKLAMKQTYYQYYCAALEKKKRWSGQGSSRSVSPMRRR